MDKFDPDKGYCFLTYAKLWIRREILEGLRKNGRLGSNHVDAIRKKIKAAVESGVDINDHKALAAAIGSPVESISRTLAAGSFTSMETIIGGDDRELTLEHTFAAAGDGQIDLVGIAERKSLLHESISGLKKRDREIMSMRFGLDGEEPMRRQAIGKRLGCSKENIRQIEERSLESLRSRFHEIGIASLSEI